MPVNLDIPRTMTVDGLRYLERLARQVPENGVIVEIGPLYGSSTWTLAQSAHPSVTVYSIDTWERVPWIIKNVEEKLGAPEFSVEAFKSFVADCPQVVPIQGYSPDVASDWDKPIDLYFDDSAHGNPAFINNLSFFKRFVKPEGIMCGDDYALGSPDIVREVDELGRQCGMRPEVAGRVWALRLPAEGADGATNVVGGLAPLEGRQLTVTAYCDLAEPHTAPPGIWSGQLQKPGHLRAFSIDWSEQLGDLDVVYRCASDKRKSPLCQAGQLCYIGDERRPITRLSVELVGAKAGNYDVHYQAGIARDAAVPFKQKVNTPMARNGNELEAPSPQAYFSALRVFLSAKE
jgi:predicted O-methyltransferase YrrM